ncbi:hypothetical protein LX64_00892 [Chitinophaga skermanii]|uniref:Uncharacterized protein n=1 Tax=Chitinophaga skermanii TaxID=331697 RepID=A0A327QWC2_9BACT|nr:hypothetical protein [Chitinophaga skermanii]RAJ08245.1 hypothetical protein LX64_00892 [Chitinophaga skermanii]
MKRMFCLVASTLCATLCYATMFAQTNIAGQFKGKYFVQGEYAPARFVIDLQQSGTGISGVYEYAMGIFEAQVKVTGYRSGNRLYFKDAVVISKRGGDLFQGNYTADITETADSIIITGNWKYTGATYFDGEWIRSSASCAPGTFRIAKEKPLSHNAQATVDATRKGYNNEMAQGNTTRQYRTLYNRSNNPAPTPSRVENATTAPVTSNTYTTLTADDQHKIQFLKGDLENLLRQLKLVDLSRSIKETTNWRVKERYADGSMKVLQFNYETGYYLSNKWSNIYDGIVTVLYRNGLPYALEGDGYNYKFEDGYTNNDYAEFPHYVFRSSYYHQRLTPTEQQNITQYFKAYVQARLANSSSYQAVLKKHRSYPAAYDCKNNLAIIAKEQYTVQWTTRDNPDYGEPFVVTKEIYDMEIGGKQPFYYYVNISNHPVIIKGILKRETAKGYTYVDDSITLQPGETTGYFDFTKEFDDQSRYNLQYISDPGVVKLIKKKS